MTIRIPALNISFSSSTFINVWKNYTAEERHNMKVRLILIICMMAVMVLSLLVDRLKKVYGLYTRKYVVKEVDDFLGLRYLNGHHKVIFKNGLKVIAKFKEGNWEGVSAEMYYPDGSYYLGEVENSQKHGNGMLFTNAGVYDGEFVQGRFVKGKITFDKTDVILEGEFEKGDLHGQGKMIIGGSEFIGEYVNGKMVKGTILYYNGDEYFGECDDIAPRGIGRKVKKDGSYEVGEFCNILMNGAKYDKDGKLLYRAIDGEVLFEEIRN